jgi:hypothetical protein
MTANRATPLARAAFAVLVVAGFLAFFDAQALKHRDPLVASWTHADVRFPRPGARWAHFHVKVTVSGPLTVSIVSDRTGRTIDVRRVRAHRYRTAQLAWDGSTSTGARAARGRYRVAVRVSGASAAVELAGLTLTLGAGS